jgi:large subunit ribosomal protein L9
MNVILLERIENLGQMGDEVKVRPGFARNYLLPQRKALRASKENRQHFERQRAQLEAVNLKRKQEAAAVAERMQGVSVDLIRQAGQSGQLYGSVSARDIADALTGAGYTVERRQVQIDRPIKSLGLFEVRIVLHPEVSVAVTVNVARSADEARLQAQRGGMITGGILEAEEEAEEARLEEEARQEAEAEFEEIASGAGEEQPPSVPLPS